MVYGYARVSSKDQNEDRQIASLEKNGVKKDRIIIDKQSGKDFERDGYRKLMKKLKPGDVLIIESIDRLGRNYTEILEEWRRITREKHCNIAVLDIPLLDTRKSKDLTTTFIADLTLQILSYVAENERENIRRRQTEGIEAARMRGVRFGRPPKERPENYPAIKKEWESGNISARKAAQKLGITHSTFLRWCKTSD